MLKKSHTILMIHGLFWFLFFIYIPLFIPLSLPQNQELQLCLPGAKHPFGCDFLGRDLLFRTLRAAQISLTLGLLTLVGAMGLGVVYGITMGFFKSVRSSLKAILSLLQAIPTILLVVWVQLIARLLMPQMAGLICALIICGFIPFAKLSYRYTLITCAEVYFEATVNLGASKRYLILNVLLPSVLKKAVQFSLTQISHLVLLESFLTFLGLGLSPYYQSLGSLTYEGLLAFLSYPHLTYFPALTLMLILLILSFTTSHLSESDLWTSTNLPTANLARRLPRPKG